MDEQLFTELRAERGLSALPGPRQGPPRRPAGPEHDPQALRRRREVPPGEINTTDPDSRMVKGQHGFLQGYNAQAAANEHQIVIAAEIEVVSPDFGHLERTLSAARRELEAAGVTELPKRGRRRLRLLAHRADATPRRRRHPGPDPARLRAANHARGRAGAAASMTSCAACWPPSTARRSTANANT